MLKRILVLLMSVIFIFALQTNSPASSNPVFGPNKYTRTTGPPNIYTDTFESCNTGATYKLTVQNGESGKDKISSASIKLNNSEIVKENEFNQKIDKIEKTVTLQKENTLNIKLSSSPSGFIKISIYCNTGCLNVQINSPISGTTINKVKTIIKGNLTNTYGETGVTIKTSGASGDISALAQTNSAEFAGQISLQQGQNTITAQAADACGYKTQDAITINTETLQENIRLTAIPSSGIPTLNATLEAETNIQNPVSKYSWDINGDGVPEYTDTDSKGQGQYQSTGLYFPKVTITDTKGNTYEETTIVNVLSKEEMDTLLKGKWEGMKGELESGDIDNAVKYFTDSSKERYREVFTALQDSLATIASEMGDIQLIYLKNDKAKYRIRRQEDDGEMTYYIYFVRDKGGFWKIYQY